MQGVKYGLCWIRWSMFIYQKSNNVHEAWVNEQPQVILLEGQETCASLSSRFELIAAGAWMA